MNKVKRYFESMEPKFKVKFFEHKGYQPIKFTFCVCLNRIVDFLALEKWGVRSSFNCYLIRATFIGDIWHKRLQ